MSVAEVALLVAMIVILLVGPWLMDRTLVTYSQCTIAVHDATAMRLTLMVPH